MGICICASFVTAGQQWVYYVNLVAAVSQLHASSAWFENIILSVTLL